MIYLEMQMIPEEILKLIEGGIRKIGVQERTVCDLKKLIWPNETVFAQRHLSFNTSREIFQLGQGL